MTADDRTATRGKGIGFEPCDDDGPWDIAQFCAHGHHPPSFGRLLALGRAMRQEWGYRHDEARVLLNDATFQTGWLGEHPSTYDLIACAEDGESNEYDEDDESITCSKVRPATWATLYLDLDPSDSRDDR